LVSQEANSLKLGIGAKDKMTRTKQLRVSARTHALRSALLAGLVACCLLLAAPLAEASAASYCVIGSAGGSCPAGTTQLPSIPAAVAATSEAGSTTIYLTSGTYVASTSFDLSNKPIRLVGVGATRPVLTAPASSGGAVVSTSNALAKFERIEIALPASSNMTGLRATNGGQMLTDVVVSGASARNSTGIELAGPNPSIGDTTISLDGSESNSRGVRIVDSTTARVADLTVRYASVGVAVENTKNFAIRRVQLFTRTGLDLQDSDGSLASSLILPEEVGVAVHSSKPASDPVNLFNCTLIHAGASGGTGLRATASGGGAAQNVVVDSSIADGFGVAAFLGNGSAGGAVGITLRYSFYNGVRSVTGGAQILEGPGNFAGVQEFGFVDQLGSDYHLRLDSPLVDQGNPISSGFSQADSGSDLDLNPRVVGRGAGAVRDVGAYEVQNRAPVPRIQIVTAVPSTTSPVEFSATGSSDADGDQLSFDWGFDALPGPTGAVVQKRFLAAGPHVVRLTATDHTGVSSTITIQFEVATGFIIVPLRSQAARLSRSGTFQVRVSCPETAISDCTGRLELRTALKVDAQRYTKRKRPKRKSKPAHLKAADQFFRIAPGTTANVQVRASQIFRNLIAVERKFQLTGGLVDATTTNALLRSNSATFTISAARAKRRH
jgi:hypothetical protein